jgi:hypothetical protein
MEVVAPKAWDAVMGSRHWKDSIYLMKKFGMYTWQEMIAPSTLGRKEDNSK